MRLPRHPNTLPTHAHRPHTVFKFTATKRAPITDTNIYRVSIITSHLTFLATNTRTTARRVESMIAPYLTALQERLQPRGIQVGSYPVLGKGVFVSLIGRDPPLDGLGGENGQTRVWLAEVAREVEIEVGGRVVSDEEIAQKKEDIVKSDSAAGPKM